MSFRNLKREPFTQIRNSAARDPHMSLSARGVLLTMLSFPDDWVYHQTHLVTLTSNGRDALRSAIRELEQLGYLRRTQVRNENGTLGDTIYEVADFPFVQDGTSTVDGKSVAGPPVAGESDTTNTDITKTPDSKESGRAPENRNRSGNEQEPLIDPPEPPPPDSADPPPPKPRSPHQQFIGEAIRAYNEERHESWAELRKLTGRGAKYLKEFLAFYDGDVEQAAQSFRAGVMWCRLREEWWREGRNSIGLDEIAANNKIENYAEKARQHQQRSQPRHRTGARAECEVGEVVLTDYGWGEILSHDPMRQGYEMRFRGVDPRHSLDNPDSFFIYYEWVHADPHTREVVKQ